jgi:aldehyde:ferredoxin oxidoreductase
VGVDPLGPDNLLVVAPGLLTGGPAPTASRVHLGARSPLTGLLGSSSIGGDLGEPLAAARVAALAVRGAAPTPSLLVLDQDGARLEPAGDLWGAETGPALGALRGRFGPRAALLAIGPSGERRAALACVVAGNGHAAGRTGMGAVLGSKLLKAIVVPGAGGRAAPAAVAAGAALPRLPLHAQQPHLDARTAAHRYVAAIMSSPRWDEVTRFGSTSGIGWGNEKGVLATRNFESGRFEHADALDGQALDVRVVRRTGCRRCPVRCKAFLTGTADGTQSLRPEFESLAALGSRLGIGDADAVLRLHERCDELGLDTLSAGATVAFAVDLFEQGIIDRRDSGGLALQWGGADEIGALLEEMGAREGFGAVFADGVRAAAARLGRGSERLAYHVKGLELTAFDPRGAFGTALGYAVANRGADYSSVYARHEFDAPPDAGDLYEGERPDDPRSPVGKAALVRRSMIVSAALDSLGLCKVPALSLVNRYDLELESELVRGVTGLPMRAADVEAAGERIVVLERLFNLACGASVADDGLPARFTRAADDPSTVAVPLEQMRAQFYALMGWTPDGRPTRARLAELDLDATEAAAGASDTAAWEVTR